MGRLRIISLSILIFFMITLITNAEGWLGVEVKEPSKEAGKKYKLYWLDDERTYRAVEVTTVYMNSPAEEAGIKPGDMLILLSQHISGLKMKPFCLQNYHLHYNKYIVEKEGETTWIQWQTLENDKRKTHNKKIIIPPKPDSLITRKTYDLETAGDALKKKGKLEEAYHKYREASSVCKTSENRLRIITKCIKTYRLLGKSTEIPEEAKKYLYIAGEITKNSKDDSELYDAISNFRHASYEAPWWPDPYFNTAVICEKLNEKDWAIVYYKLYIVAAPSAADKEEVEKKIVYLEYQIKEGK